MWIAKWIQLYIKTIVYSVKRYRYQSFIHRLWTLKERVHVSSKILDDILFDLKFLVLKEKLYSYFLTMIYARDQNYATKGAIMSSLIRLHARGSILSPKTDREMGKKFWSCEWSALPDDLTIIWSFSEWPFAAIRLLSRQWSMEIPIYAACRCYVNLTEGSDWPTFTICFFTVYFKEFRMSKDSQGSWYSLKEN